MGEQENVLLCGSEGLGGVIAGKNERGRQTNSGSLCPLQRENLEPTEVKSHAQGIWSASRGQRFKSKAHGPWTAPHPPPLLGEQDCHGVSELNEPLHVLKKEDTLRTFLARGVH